MKTVRFQDTEIPVGKILCLGLNYMEHAKEMGTRVPEQPVVFIKPSTAIIRSGDDVSMPAISSELHHEVELVLLVGTTGTDIPATRAYEHVAGYGVGLDMTLRDVQSVAKKKGEPWALAKGFDTSAPVSTIVDKKNVPDPHNLEISLKVNGQFRQKSNTRNMIFRIEYVVSFLSSIFTLESGDLIFTGTPPGVASVVPGDVLEAELGNLARLRVGVKRPARALQTLP
jgi:2-keto-4-pentenoate hydratase/2-oxohepta-3-ene-1,7-dioic acid hydratase in catechol pathway